MTEKLIARAAIQISKTPQEVFEAIVDPAKMSNYFILKGSGRMEEGKIITWSFPEMEGEFPVKPGKIEKDKLVSFHWDYSGHEMLIEIKLTPYKNATVVQVSEGSMPNDKEGIKWVVGNTEGWSNFLASMKAWLEYGIHLRKGAFDFRFDEHSPVKMG